MPEMDELDRETCSSCCCRVPWYLFLPQHLCFSWSVAPSLGVGIPVFRCMVYRDILDLEVKAVGPRLSSVGSFVPLCLLPAFSAIFPGPCVPRAALLEPAFLLSRFLSLPTIDLWVTSSSSALVSQACHTHLTWADTDTILDRHFRLGRSPSSLEEKCKVWLGAPKLAVLHPPLTCLPVC